MLAIASKAVTGEDIPAPEPVPHLPAAPAPFESMAGRVGPYQPRPPRPLLRARPGVRIPHGIAVGPRELQWDRLEVGPLVQEDRQYEGLPGIPERIGVNRPLPDGAITSDTAGTWTTLEDGTRLWSLRLVVPDAHAVRVHFDRFEVPAAARVLVTGSADAPADVYTARMQMSDGGLWTAPVRGPVVHIEYEAPADAMEEPALRIHEISHIYRDPFPSDRIHESPYDSRPMNEVQQLLDCHEDVNCHAVDPAVRDAVGRMIFTIGSHTYACTGTLLNDIDPNTFAGYFLTAHHCISTQSAADTLTVYWFYQTDTCDGAVPVLEELPKTLGSTLLATSSATDFSFLRLADDPRDGQGFAGWTSAEPFNDVSIIHHPQSTHKRIAYGLATTSPPICVGWPLSHYWYVRLNLGAVEGGSSGGPLFNDVGQVVGQLFGACFTWGNEPGCDNYDKYNLMFGKFGISYPFFQSYLNTIIPDDPYEPNDTIEEAVNLEPGLYELRLVDFDDYFAITLPVEGEVSATALYDPADMDLDLELLTEDGDLLDESRGASGTESVSAVVPRGTYIVRAHKKHGWGGDYTLELAAPRIRGDFDLDGDVDMDDFAHLQVCLSGRVTPQTDPNCFNARLAGDLDVDFEDVTLFLECLSGPFVTPPPECGP